MEEFEFICTTCGDTHRGIPTFGWDYPIQVSDVPEEERADRVALGSDDCVIDEKWFFVRGCIEIPVHGFDDPFSWGAWVSLSRENFDTWAQYFGEEQRSHIGPFFGWLAGDFWPYDRSCLNLKTHVHLRDNGIRPFIEIEPTDHPLAQEQVRGIDRARVQEIFEIMMHKVEGDG